MVIKVTLVGFRGGDRPYRLLDQPRMKLAFPDRVHQ